VSLLDDIIKQLSGQNVKSSGSKKQLHQSVPRDGFVVQNRPGHTKITEAEAMEIPAVASSINLITSAIAKLPINLYTTDGEGDAELIKDDDRLFLLNQEPNDAQTSTTLKKRLVTDYLFYGGSYLYVRKKVRSNAVKDLYRLPVEKISVIRFEEQGYITKYKIHLDGQPEDTIKTIDVACILKDTEDGFKPRGILNEGHRILSAALDEIDYSSSILKNGSLPLAVLKSATQLSPEAIGRIRQDWEALYTGTGKAGKTVLLEEGLEYQPVSMKPNELELTDSKKGHLSDIARLFNIPESMINANANKYNSNEENNIHFLQYTLEPILINIEKALNKTMLLESEKKSGLYFKFDTSAILVVTEQEKAEIAKTLNETSSVTQNEIRKVLNLPKLENNYMFLSQGKVFYNTQTGRAFNPNMGIEFDPENPVDSIKGDDGQLEPNKDPNEKVSNEEQVKDDSNTDNLDKDIKEGEKDDDEKQRKE